MKTCNGRMVDEPCTRKSFLENDGYNGWKPMYLVDGYSFIWTSTMFMFCRYKKKIENEEDQIPWKIEDEDKGKRRYRT
jgi:hypothetical protein